VRIPGSIPALIAMAGATLLLMLAGAQMPVGAQQMQDFQQQSVDNASFSLQASMTERPRLTREEVNPAAVGVPTIAQSPFGGASVMPVDPTIALNSLPIQAAVAPALPPATRPALKSTAATTVHKVPSASLNAHAKAGPNDDLYSVDWSQWVTQLADRWFFNLKRLETMTGRDFHSPRAAQIRFTCYPDGTIGNISLEQSSGVPTYDQLQIQALVQTMPVHPFPHGTLRKSVTLVQGWEAHPRRPGESDFQPGSFGQGFPQEKVNRWNLSR
jgi:hypothetical protein